MSNGDRANFRDNLTAYGTFGAAVVAALALVFSAWSFNQTNNNQDEASANRILQEHIKIRVDNPSATSIVRELENDYRRYEDLTWVERGQYADIAIHSLTSLESIYTIKNEDPEWRDTVQGWIWVYWPVILNAGLDCGDYNPEFIALIEETLNASRSDFCAGTSYRTYAWPERIVVVIVFIIVGLLFWRHPRVRQLFSR